MLEIKQLCRTIIEERDKYLEHAYSFLQNVKKGPKKPLLLTSIVYNAFCLTQAPND